MKKISLDKLNDLFFELAQIKELYLPVEGNGGAAFKKWTGNEKLSNSLNTVKSAKDCFFPQVENIVDFKLTRKSIFVIENDEEIKDFIVFGVRACDEQSFSVLDRVFLSEPIDSFYAARRNAATIITLACNRPSETCFCNAFGITPENPKGDVSCIIANGFLYWTPLTDKGILLTNSLTVLEDTADETQNERENIKKIMLRLPLSNLPVDKFGKGKTSEYFNSEKWDKLYRGCLGCGTCTFICPTCQCYDIQEFDTGKKVKRFRCWDSCMYSEFTKMSAGQPRATQKERFRQRFMHKLVYFPDNNDGMFSCVGCGRCIKSCPNSLNIVKVMKELGGTENE